MSRARAWAPSPIFAVALLPVLALFFGFATACIEAPPYFEIVTLERASELLLRGGATLVEVAGPDQPSASPHGGRLRWELGEGEPPAVAGGPVVLLARRTDVGHRAAATLARRRRGVFLFVSDNAEDRRRLYALRPHRGEAT
jgi:hypothetical protein